MPRPTFSPIWSARPRDRHRPFFIGRAERVNRFNQACPLLSRADEFRFDPSDPAGSRSVFPYPIQTGANAYSIYYGVNISPYKEPLEQFDPLLLVRFWNQLQGARAQEDEAAPRFELTVFVAGKYRLLNLSQDQDPYPRVKQWEADELRKKNLFERAAGRLGMEQDVSVLITDQLWSDTRYWQALCRLVERKNELLNQRIFREPEKAVRFGDLPRYLLGGITDSQRERLAPFKGCELYLYAELAEAYYLRDAYGVKAKIGPRSEEEYDRYLRPDFTIVQLKNPLELDSRPGQEKSAIPYIGQKGEERI
ncbi:MAG: hypothetical protein V1728_03580 [Candidatus Micrarchaeota archaeon]